MSGFLLLHVATIYVTVLFFGGITEQSDFVPWWLNLVALVLIARTLLPVRAWLRPRIDALLHQGREDVYGAIASLSSLLDNTADTRDILPLVAQTIARTMDLPWVRIEDHRSPGSRAGEVGRLPASSSTVDLPLGFRDTSIGSLRVAPRWPEGGMTSAELRLLADLARQVSITLHAMHLSDELQASRMRLVSAREEERLRLRRDLHDGLGPSLSALRLQLRALRAVVRSDPERAEALVDELQADLRATTAEIRSLVFALRPPLLDEHGLLGAIQHLDVGLDGVSLQVEATVNLPALPAAVEVASYRIAAEAVHNVARHARATACWVTLAVVDGQVQLRIEDNGVGLLAGDGEGVGLHSMRERSTELGGCLRVSASHRGGTCVEASLPLGRDNRAAPRPASSESDG